MIQAIESLGPYIHDCSVRGETRADGAWPAMADVMALSRDRWLVLYSTRGWLGVDDGFRGNDNDRSVIYQLRKDGPTGEIVKEGIFSRYVEDWDALGDGGRCLRQHCQTGCFGVPKGALINGVRVPHENVFVATWYRCPRKRGTGLHDVPPIEVEEDLFDRAFGIEWAQFRLREDNEDIELIQTPRPMRQKGFEKGPRFCDMDPVCAMNQWYVKPAPYTADMSEWVKLPHFARGIAAIRFAFNRGLGLYEWVQTGPLLDVGRQSGMASDPRTPYRLTETSLLRYRDDWVIAARTSEPGSKNIPGTGWIRTDDLFRPLPKPFFPGEPRSNAPTGVFQCADGVVRIFTGDPTLSPYSNERDPLFCWDVDLNDNSRLSNRRVVFDAVAAGLPVQGDTGTRIDMPNLIPHAGGAEQLLLFRVRLRRSREPFTRIVPEEKHRSALYHAKLAFDKACPPAWRFA